MESMTTDRLPDADQCGQSASGNATSVMEENNGEVVNQSQASLSHFYSVSDFADLVNTWDPVVALKDITMQSGSAVNYQSCASTSENDHNAADHNAFYSNSLTTSDTRTESLYHGEMSVLKHSGDYSRDAVIEGEQSESSSRTRLLSMEFEKRPFDVRMFEIKPLIDFGSLEDSVESASDSFVVGGETVAVLENPEGYKSQSLVEVTDEPSNGRTIECLSDDLDWKFTYTDISPENVDDSQNEHIEAAISRSFKESDSVRELELKAPVSNIVSELPLMRTPNYEASFPTESSSVRQMDEFECDTGKHQATELQMELDNVDMVNEKSHTLNSDECTMEKLRVYPEDLARLQCAAGFMVGNLKQTQLEENFQFDHCIIPENAIIFSTVNVPRIEEGDGGYGQCRNGDLAENAAQSQLKAELTMDNISCDNKDDSCHADFVSDGCQVEDIRGTMEKNVSATVIDVCNTRGVQLMHADEDAISDDVATISDDIAEKDKLSNEQVLIDVNNLIVDVSEKKDTDFPVDPLTDTAEEQHTHVSDAQHTNISEGQHTDVPKAQCPLMSEEQHMTESMENGGDDRNIGGNDVSEDMLEKQLAKREKGVCADNEQSSCEQEICQLGSTEQEIHDSVATKQETCESQKCDNESEPQAQEACELFEKEEYDDKEVEFCNELQQCNDESCEQNCKELERSEDTVLPQDELENEWAQNNNCSEAPISDGSEIQPAVHPAYSMSDEHDQGCDHWQDNDQAEYVSDQPDHWQEGDQVEGVSDQPDQWQDVDQVEGDSDQPDQWQDGDQVEGISDQPDQWQDGDQVEGVLDQPDQWQDGDQVEGVSDQPDQWQDGDQVEGVSGQPDQWQSDDQVEGVSDQPDHWQDDDQIGVSDQWQDGDQVEGTLDQPDQWQADNEAENISEQQWIDENGMTESGCMENDDVSENWQAETIAGESLNSEERSQLNEHAEDELREVMKGDESEQLVERCPTNGLVQENSETVVTGDQPVSETKSVCKEATEQHADTSTEKEDKSLHNTSVSAISDIAIDVSEENNRKRGVNLQSVDTSVDKKSTSSLCPESCLSKDASGEDNEKALSQNLISTSECTSLGDAVPLTVEASKKRILLPCPEVNEHKDEDCPPTKRILLNTPQNPEVAQNVNEETAIPEVISYYPKRTLLNVPQNSQLQQFPDRQYEVDGVPLPMFDPNIPPPPTHDPNFMPPPPQNAMMPPPPQHCMPPPPNYVPPPQNYMPPPQNYLPPPPPQNCMPPPPNFIPPPQNFIPPPPNQMQLPPNPAPFDPPQRFGCPPPPGVDSQMYPPPRPEYPLQYPAEPYPQPPYQPPANYGYSGDPAWQQQSYVQQPQYPGEYPGQYPAYYPAPSYDPNQYQQQYYNTYYCHNQPQGFAHPQAVQAATWHASGYNNPPYSQTGGEISNVAGHSVQPVPSDDSSQKKKEKKAAAPNYRSGFVSYDKEDSKSSSHHKSDKGSKSKGKKKKVPTATLR